MYACSLAILSQWHTYSMLGTYENKYSKMAAHSKRCLRAETVYEIISLEDVKVMQQWAEAEQSLNKSLTRNSESLGPAPSSIISVLTKQTSRKCLCLIYSVCARDVFTGKLNMQLTNWGKKHVFHCHFVYYQQFLYILYIFCFRL